MLPSITNLIRREAPEAEEPLESHLAQATPNSASTTLSQNIPNLTPSTLSVTPTPSTLSVPPNVIQANLQPLGRITPQRSPSNSVLRLSQEQIDNAIHQATQNQTLFHRDETTKIFCYVADITNIECRCSIPCGKFKIGYFISTEDSPPSSHLSRLSQCCPELDIYWSYFEISEDHAKGARRIGLAWEKDIHRKFSRHNLKGKEIFRKDNLSLQTVRARIRKKGEELAAEYEGEVFDGELKANDITRKKRKRKRSAKDDDDDDDDEEECEEEESDEEGDEEETNRQAKNDSEGRNNGGEYFLMFLTHLFPGLTGGKRSNKPILDGLVHLDSFEEKSLDIIAHALGLFKSKKTLHVIGACDVEELKYFANKVSNIVIYEYKELFLSYLERSKDRVISRSNQVISIEQLNYEFHCPPTLDSLLCLYFTNTGGYTFQQDLWVLRLIEKEIDCHIISIEHPLYEPSRENDLGQGNLRTGGKLHIFQYLLNESSRDKIRSEIQLKMENLFQKR